jgi:pimeloyl-ACP methyl ester carboxylesterase
MKRLVFRGVFAIVALLVVLIAAGLGYRAWRQNENAKILAIHTPNGIEEAEFIRIGGIDQWVQIRGQDRRNPVILFMHGGPGSSETVVSALLQPWEKYFTVVMWDERCAGKTFVRGGAKSCAGMSVESVAHEGIELVENLRYHLHKNKIIALGHSWGTMIGVRMVKERPDLFSAYVGTGQVVSIPEKEPVNYADAMARLRAAHDQSGIDALQKIGPPPYKQQDDISVERDWSERYDIPSERDLFANLRLVAAFAPGWSLWDIYQSLQASNYANKQTFTATSDYDARKLGPKFDVPFFVINGAQDRVTPAKFAKAYVDFVQAPHKEFIAIGGAGHSAVLTKPDVFLHELVTRVRPIAIQNEAGAFHG